MESGNVYHQNNKRKRSGKRNKNSNQKGGERQAYDLITLIKENDAFFEYCRRQKIVPEDEFKEFEDILRVDLPASFRIQRSLPERDEFVRYLDKTFFQSLRDLNDENVHCPEPIPFIPFAYQTTNTRATIRSSPILSKLHQFLISEVSTGSLSRQEAVSMVPPLLLDIQPGHFVFDACASPGSKTMQIAELMHEKTANPEGLFIANDVDNSRCYLLIHQTLKRLPTANCVVVNHDASNMPAPIDKDGRVIFFDRILCDVICSGDGTFRKNPQLWRDWNPTKGANLHKLQKLIAVRCLELLKVGGLMAYSTCSLNPIEDEAVLAHLLRKYKGCIELVNVSGELPKLKRSPGLSTWKVINAKMHEYSSFQEALDARDKSIAQSMFPPTEEEIKEFNLDRSFRILPHAQNSGGFFVAIIRKTADLETKLDVDKEKFKRVPAKKRRHTVREEPFIFLTDKDHDFKTEIYNVFGIDQSFPFENLLVRNINNEAKRAVYFVNDALREFIKNNSNRFHLINAGVNVMRKVDKIGISNYRLAQDGVSVFFPYMTKRIIELDVEDMKKALLGSNGNHYVQLYELSARSKFAELPPGSIVLQVKYKGISKEVCAWMGTSTVSIFITREEKIHLINLLDGDSTALQQMIKTTRKEKAQRALSNKDNNEDNLADGNGDSNAEQTAGEGEQSMEEVE